MNEKNNIKPKPINYQNRLLLIDEVDVFFSDMFYGKTYNPI